MIRLAELALFLAPLAAFGVWQFAIRRGLPGPSPASLAVILAMLLLFGAGLVWMSLDDRGPAGSHYVPAELRGGRILPGHPS